MKDLSTEEKAKRYDEAIEKAEKWRNAPNVDKIPTFGNRIIEDIFPELKESKKEWIEKIRQELKSYLEHRKTEQISESDAVQQWITWLEKQDAQKPSWSEEDEISLLDVLWCCKKAASIAKDENEMGTVWCAERWLDSLRDKCTWKPTEKQINAIRLARSFVTDDFSENPTLSEILLELEKQLKKIMEA